MPGIPCIYYGSEWGTKANKSEGDSALRAGFDKPEFGELAEWIAKLAEVKALKYACNPTYIVVIHKIEQMHSFIQRPFLWPILPNKRMTDFKHIHTVKTRVHPMIAFIVCDRMAHFIICPLFIISMQCFAHQRKFQI